MSRSGAREISTNEIREAARRSLRAPRRGDRVNFDPLRRRPLEEARILRDLFPTLRVRFSLVGRVTLTCVRCICLGQIVWQDGEAVAEGEVFGMFRLEF